MKTTDTVVLLGGLGNQMFQYAFMKAMQVLYPSRRFCIDPYSESAYLVHHNGFELARLFGVPDSEVIDESWAETEEYLKKPIFWEDAENRGALVFNKAVRNLQADMPSHAFYGYWQSERYFQDICQQIRQIYRFPDLDAANQLLADEIYRANSVAVHIRRGDYVKSMHDLLDIEYYGQAMQRMQKELPDPPVFYLFSDDEAYCRQQFKRYEQVFQIRYVVGNAHENAWKDMALMQKARHFIIANSSFSWWGAYLGEYPSKKVYAPKQWFVSVRHGYWARHVPATRYEIQDICPADWTLLETRERANVIVWIVLKSLLWNSSRGLRRSLQICFRSWSRSFARLFSGQKH